MKKNFKIIGGFGVSEKEIAQKKIDIKDVINKYYDVGVEEFFVGYNPEYWHSKYSFSISPNGRFGENENISSFETFKDAVHYIHTLKSKDGKICEALLTVNGWFYNDITLPLAKRIIQEAISIGIDGFIVGSFEILKHLSEIKYKGKIHISTILNTYNSDAIRLYIDFCKKHNLDLNRIVLPREVTLKEIKSMCDDFPELNFEVFGQGDYCRYSNGNCFAEHKYFSRDLCSFVLKNGLNIKKRVRYDFKEIILDKIKNDKEKQYLLNPRIDAVDGTNDIERLRNIYTGNAIIQTSTEILDIYHLKYSELLDILYKRGDYDFEELDNIYHINEMLKITKLELLLNETKYYYDGLNNEGSKHNLYILKCLNFFNLLLNCIKILNIKYDDKYKNDIKLFEDKIQKFEEIKEVGKKYFLEELKTRGEFSLETYYKFMLYNRTSAPFFSFFNSIPNIKVVKIPLRGRDPVVFKMGIDLIDDAIKDPKKYLNMGLNSLQYYHYDNTVLK